MLKRWSVSIFFRSGNELVEAKHAVEEIEDLQGIVEGGPDWNTIDKIEIRLARVTTPGMTLQTQDGGNA